MKTPMHSRKQSHVGEPAQAQAFSAFGFIPDLTSEHRATTFPAANRTLLEDGVLGKEGMLPAPGVSRVVSPSYVEGGTGGAGSFNTSVAQPKEQQ